MRATAISLRNATLNGPQGVAVDAAGNIYIADTGDNRVRMVQATTGNIEAFAGNWNVPTCTSPTQPCGDGGSSKLANLNGPTALAVDKKNNSLEASPTAGTTGFASSFPKRKSSALSPATERPALPRTARVAMECPGVAASMGPPRGVAADQLGNVYIADTRDNRIRMVSSGTISTVMLAPAFRGYSGDGGSATTAMLAGPAGLRRADASEKHLHLPTRETRAIRKVSFRYHQHRIRRR